MWITMRMEYCHHVNLVVIVDVADNVWESFDEGETFTRVGDVPGPTAGVCKYVTVDSVPPGTRKALVRFQGTRQRNTLCIFNLRVDADYREPFGGFRPVKITYVWDEGGVEKSHVHVARKLNQTYEIVCGEPPLMKSLILELSGVEQ